MTAAEMAADVAAVLDSAVLGKLGVVAGRLPDLFRPEGTQIYPRDGRTVVDHVCKCTVKAVRARVMALYAERHGRELPELLTPAEAKAKERGQDSQRPRRSRGPLGRDR